MMFSLSPAITGKPHSSAESAGSKPSSGVSQTSLSPSHSTPSQPHKPEQRSTPHTAPQAPTHGTTTHSSTVTQSHGNVAHSPTHSHTRENAPHTVSHPHTQGSTALTPTPDPQSIVRPRPRSNSSGSKVRVWCTYIQGVVIVAKQSEPSLITVQTASMHACMHTHRHTHTHTHTAPDTNKPQVSSQY